MFVIIHDLLDDDYAQIKVVDDKVVESYCYRNYNQVWGSLLEVLEPISSISSIGWGPFSEIDLTIRAIITTSDQLITSNTHPELVI